MASNDKRAPVGSSHKQQLPARPSTAGAYRPRTQPNYGRSSPAFSLRTVPKLASPPLRTQNQASNRPLLTTDSLRPLENRIRAIEGEAAKSSKDRTAHKQVIDKVARKDTNAQRLVDQMRRSMSDGFMTRAPTLGFDSLRTPSRGMAYARGNFTLNNDGSGSLIANPNFANFYSISNTTYGDGNSPTTWYPALNKGGDALNAITARPLTLTVKTWADIAPTAIPGRVTSGCLNYGEGDVSFPQATAFDSSGLPTAGIPNPCTLYTVQYKAQYYGASSSYTGGQNTTHVTNSFLTAIPSFKESLGSSPVLCTWKPSEMDQLDFDPSYAGAPPTKVWVPAMTFQNTANMTSVIGASSGNSVASSPLMGYNGPYCVVAYDGLPAASIIYFEIFYEFEYLSDSSTASSAPTVNGPMAADHFPNKETFYREVLSVDPPKVDLPAEKEGFFGSVGKAIKSFLATPLPELILDGISMLFGATPDAPHQVYRVGNEFMISSTGGNRFLSSREAEAYLQEKAISAYKAGLETEKKLDPPPTRSSSITPSEADAIEDFHSFERARRKHEELSRHKTVNK